MEKCFWILVVLLSACGVFGGDVPEPTAKTAVQAAQVACRAAGYDSLDECAAGLAERADSPKGAPGSGPDGGLTLLPQAN